jgi:5-methylcytosine-specific restriction endonuclease McrA
MRACLTCGTLVQGSSYCSAHRPDRKPRRSLVGWQAKRRLVLARDLGVCRMCGAAATCVDHIIPLARGGSDEYTNLQAACATCNARKGARLMAPGQDSRRL